MLQARNVDLGDLVVPTDVQYRFGFVRLRDVDTSGHEILDSTEPLAKRVGSILQQFEPSVVNYWVEVDAYPENQR